MVALLVFFAGSHRAQAADKAVVISEVRLGTAASASDEFVELYNNSSVDADISGWSLYYKSATGKTWSKKATIGPSATLKAHNFWVLASEIAANTPLSSGLAQTGGNIELRDGQDASMDRLAWGSGDNALGQPTPAPASDEVLFRGYADATHTMVNTDNNFNDFSLTTTASPGAITVTLPNPPGDGDPGTYAPLVINELLPNPASPLTDNSDEFIELYNPTSTTVDLAGWSLRDASGKVFELKGQTIEANGYLSLPSSETAISLNNSGDEVELIAPNGSVADRSADYGTAKEGLSWGLVGGAWTWTVSPTPGAPNSAAYADEATSPAKVVATKKASKASSASAKTSKTKSAAAKAATPNKLSNAPAGKLTDQLAGNTTLWMWLLIALGVGTIGYGIYEYRPEIITLYYRLKSKFGAGSQAG